jgi:hypothetical protein
MFWCRHEKRADPLLAHIIVTLADAARSAGADLNSRRLARSAEYRDVICNLVTLVCKHFQELKRYPLSRV